jgi:hypothetical protein
MDTPTYADVRHELVVCPIKIKYDSNYIVEKIWLTTNAFFARGVREEHFIYSPRGIFGHLWMKPLFSWYLLSDRRISPPSVMLGNSDIHYTHKCANLDSPRLGMRP